MNYKFIKETKEYFPKNTFRHDTLGINIIVGRDVSDADAKEVIDKLIGITKIFKSKRIVFDISEAFNTLAIVASQEERNIMYPHGGNRWNGFYERSQDLIVIDVEKCKNTTSQNSGAYDYLDYILVHEIAHAIHLKYISQDSKDQYDDITKIFLNQIRLRERIIKKVNNFNIGILAVALGSDEQVNNFTRRNKVNKDFYQKAKNVYKSFKPAKIAESLILTHLVYDLKIKELKDEYFEESSFWQFNEQMIPLNTNYFLNKMKIRFSHLIYKAESTIDELYKLFDNLYNCKAYQTQFNSLNSLRNILDNIRTYYLQGDEESKKKAEALFQDEGESVEDYFFDIPDVDMDDIYSSIFYIKETKEFSELALYFENLNKKEKFDDVDFQYNAREVIEEMDQKEVNEFIINKELEDLSKKERDSLNIENILPKNLLALYKEKYQINEKQYRQSSRDSDKFKDLKISTFAIRDLMPTIYGLTNKEEDFAENFSLFILNPSALEQWNINRLIKLMTQTRAQGRTIMQAHKNIFLNKYISLIIENIMLKGRE